jgi:hypothetical protein
LRTKHKKFCSMGVLTGKIMEPPGIDAIYSVWLGKTHCGVWNQASPTGHSIQCTADGGSITSTPTSTLTPTGRQHVVHVRLSHVRLRTLEQKGA